MYSTANLSDREGWKSIIGSRLVWIGHPERGLNLGIDDATLIESIHADDLGRAVVTVWIMDKMIEIVLDPDTDIGFEQGPIRYGIKTTPPTSEDDARQAWIRAWHTIPVGVIYSSGYNDLTFLQPDGSSLTLTFGVSNRDDDNLVYDRLLELIEVLGTHQFLTKSE